MFELFFLITYFFPGFDIQIIKCISHNSISKKMMPFGIVWSKHFRSKSEKQKYKINKALIINEIECHSSTKLIEIYIFSISDQTYWKTQWNLDILYWKIFLWDVKMHDKLKRFEYAQLRFLDHTYAQTMAEPLSELSSEGIIHHDCCDQTVAEFVFLWWLACTSCMYSIWSSATCSSILRSRT